MKIHCCLVDGQASTVLAGENGLSKPHGTRRRAHSAQSPSKELKGEVHWGSVEI